MHSVSQPAEVLRKEQRGTARNGSLGILPSLGRDRGSRKREGSWNRRRGSRQGQGQEIQVGDRDKGRGSTHVGTGARDCLSELRKSKGMGILGKSPYISGYHPSKQTLLARGRGARDRAAFPAQNTSQLGGKGWPHWPTEDLFQHPSQVPQLSSFGL